MDYILILDVTQNWFLTFFRYFFAFFDFCVYGLITVFFRTIFNLANFELVGFYESFEERIYVILGIFMLFKVTVSILTYLINPDKITDKEQGMGKVVTRIITVLIMLIALPTFFNLLTEFQNKLLPVIPRVIVGTTNELSSDSMTDITNSMTTTLLQGFAHVKDNCGANEIDNVANFLVHINDECSETNNTYKYDYLPIVSTVVGIIMVYVLFSLSITVAIRAFKLIILRMLAPVPVISYVDPKSSKNGMFSTWIKTFFTTWAELFILLGIIYFIVYMIDFLIFGEAWKGFFDSVSNPIEGIILLAFIIVGLLMFAQSAPKFIFDALGIKNKGSFTRMLGMGATAIGGVGNIASQMRQRNQYDRDHNNGNVHRLRNFGASLFSGIGALTSAGNELMSSDKPNVLTGVSSINKNAARASERIAVGSGLIGGISSFGHSLITGESASQLRERNLKNREDALKLEEDALKTREAELKQNSTQNSFGKSLIDRADSKAKTDLRTTATYTLDGKTYTGNYARYSSWAENVKSGHGVYTRVVNGVEETFAKFNGVEINTNDIDVVAEGLLKGNQADYFRQAVNDHNFDDGFNQIRTQYEASGGQTAANYGTQKANNGQLEATINTEQREINAAHTDINNRRATITEEKNSLEAQRDKLNDNYFGTRNNK